MNNLEDLLRHLSEISGAPIPDLKEFWESGEEVCIPSMVEINSPDYLSGYNFVLLDGIVREYFTDTSNKEHTLRFVQAPNMMSPSWTELVINKPTKLSSQALTPLRARIWPFQDVYNLAIRDGIFFKIMMIQMIEALRVKNLNEIRRHQFTARERYEAFLEDFPGMVNKVPLKYVASYLNITSETLSRVRAELSQS